MHNKGGLKKHIPKRLEQSNTREPRQHPSALAPAVQIPARKAIDFKTFQYSPGFIDRTKVIAMERKEVLDKARALYQQVKREGLPGGWTVKEEIDFQQNGEDLSIDVVCEPYKHFEESMQAKEELEVELVSTALQELERKGMPPTGESYRQDVQVIKSELGESFRLYLVLNHYDATARSAG